MVRILHDDWSVRLGENRPDQGSYIFGEYVPHVRSSTMNPTILFLVG